ncbi:MAG: hypothetical protein HQL84_14610, partial [Magnetococcales bacterium]|nr:hypothetical protein [Magnetococcales bacterium]
MSESIINLINHPGLPWGVSALIVFWGLFALLRFRALILPMHQELTDAIATIAAHGTPRALARDLETLDTQFANSTLLAAAWRAYRATLFVSERTETLQSAEIAEKHFNIEHLGHPLSRIRSLQSIPSLMANTGLVFTFFSLVAAIHVSADSILAHDSVPSAPAIQELLQITSFKFLTSIAGILTAMLFSAVIRKHLRLLEVRLVHFATALTRLIQEVPREAMVFEHLAHTGLHADTRKELLEQLPQLADSMSTRLTSDLDQHLGGMIRQVTRQFIDETRRENARHHQNQESLLADWRTEVKRDLAEVRETTGEGLQRLRDLPPPPPPPAPPNLDAIIATLRQETRHLRESLAEQIAQQSSQTVPFGQHILEALHKLEGMERRQEELKGRMQTMEEDWRTALAAIEAGMPDTTETHHTLVTMGQQIMEESGRLSEQLKHTLAVIQRDLAQTAAHGPPAAPGEPFKAREDDLDQHTPSPERQGMELRQEVDRMLQELHRETQRLSELQRQSMETALTRFNQDLETTLIPPIVEAIRHGQEDLAQRMEGLDRRPPPEPSVMVDIARETNPFSPLATLEPLIHAVRDETGRVAGRIDTLTLSLHEENRILGRQVDELKQTLMEESGRIAGQTDELIRRVTEEGRKTAGRVGDLGNQLREGAAQNRTLMETFGQELTQNLNGLGQRIDASTRTLQATMPTADHLMEWLRKEHQTILGRLDGLTGRLREELTQTTANQHQLLLQLLGDAPHAHDAAATLEPLLKTLDQMNGGLHLRMEDMLTTLRQETDRMAQTQRHILELSERANQVVAEGFDRRPPWEEALKGLDSALGGRMESMLELLDQKGNAITAAHRTSIEQLLRELPHHEELKQALVPMQQALAEEYTRMITRIDRLEQELANEARLIAGQHLEAVRTAITEGMQHDEKAFDWEPVFAEIRHHAALQPQREDLTAATRSVIHEMETRTERIMEQVDRSLQSASHSFSQVVATHGGQVMEQVDHTVQHLGQPILQSLESQIGRVMEHMDHSFQSATQPLFHSVETQTGRIVEQMGHAIQTATDIFAQTVATHTGRVAEQVQVTIHDSSRPILEAMSANTGQILERMDQSVQTAANALTQTVATHTGRVAEQVQVTIHDSSRP